MSSVVQTRTTDEILKMVKQRQGASSAIYKQQNDWKPNKAKSQDEKNKNQVEATARDDDYTQVQVAVNKI